MTNMARQQMEGSSFTKNLTAEQKEAAIAAADTPTRKVIGIVAAGLVIGVMLLFFALLFMAVAGMSGGPMKFSQALGTACYVAWPFSLITAVLSILVVYISPDRSVLDPQHLLAFNVGAFLDKTTTSKPLYALASSFDVLLFAQMAFAGWGLARVAQIPFARALGGVIGIWVLFTAIRMGFSLVF